MSKIFMHIGMNKAGSSSIQASFDQFDDGTTRYARIGSPNHSVKIVSLFCQNPQQNVLLSKRNLNSAALARTQAADEALLRREIALGRDTLVISGEGIGHMKVPDITAMKTYFETHGCTLKLFAYIREPFGFASSAFQQRVKGNMSSFRVGLPHYREQFESFVDVFSPDDIEFVDFRQSKLCGGSVVTDFAARIGLDPLASIVEVRRNESLSATVVALLYFWNRERGDLGRDSATNVARQKLTEALRQRFPGKFRLSSTLVRNALDPDDVAWMERASGIGLRFELDKPQETEPGAIRSEDDLAAARDAAVPELAALLDELGIGRPRKPDALPMMRWLFHHFTREARTDIRQRKVRRTAAA